jgi:hypothetical protein
MDDGESCSRVTAEVDCKGSGESGMVGLNASGRIEQSILMMVMVQVQVVLDENERWRQVFMRFWEVVSEVRPRPRRRLRLRPSLVSRTST